MNWLSAKELIYFWGPIGADCYIWEINKAGLRLGAKVSPIAEFRASYVSQVHCDQ